MKKRLKHIVFLVLSGSQFFVVIVSYVWKMYFLSAFAKAKKENI
ncbi:hypothetical protein [uncultured Dokdonia sp.]|nr:hypothetical protein [uncultured Dokdonia sp.]